MSEAYCIVAKYFHEKENSKKKDKQKLQSVSHKYYNSYACYSTLKSMELTTNQLNNDTTNILYNYRSRHAQVRDWKQQEW